MIGCGGVITITLMILSIVLIWEGLYSEQSIVTALGIFLWFLPLCIGLGCSGYERVSNSTYYSFNNITCSEGVEHDCGYELSECSDSNRYECVNNVKVVTEEEGV